MQQQDQPPAGVDPETGEVLPDRPGFDFLMFVSSHRKGAMNLDITDSMDELVEQVVQIGKKGTMTITLSVTPVDNKLDPVITIEDEVKIRPPKRAAEGSIYFIQTANGQFSRNPPQQSIPGFGVTDHD